VIIKITTYDVRLPTTMKRAIYLPTNQNTVVISEFDNYYELLLDGDYKTVPKAEVKLLDSSVKICGLQELKENIFINCIKNPINDILYSLNSDRLIPEPHQYKPLTKFLNSDVNRLLIADEVGLGKTIEAGMIYKEIRSREDLKISIIVVPSSLTYKWKDELRIRFEEFFEIKNVKQFLGFIEDFDNYNSLKTFDEKIIINYHILRDERVVEKIRNSFLEVDFLIMDEAHSFRNSDTSTFEGAKLLTSVSDNILFLTATPVQNDLRDLFNVLSLLDNEFFMDFDYFKRMLKPNKIIHTIIGMIRNNQNLDKIKSYIKKNEDKISNKFLIQIFNRLLHLNQFSNELRIEIIDELTRADHLSFIVNRTKKRDVGRLLPRNVKSVIVELTKEETDFYNAVIDFVLFIHPNSPPGFITIMPERMASSSMLASFESFKKMRKEEKLFIKDIDDLDDIYEEIEIKKEALKYLDQIIQKGLKIGQFDSKFLKFIEILNSIQKSGIKQIIVFSFFKNTLNYLADKLIELNYKVGIIHGDYTVEERYEIIKSFKNKNFDILLSSEVGSEGLDMQFSNVIVNYDLPWNPMRVEQRIGRIDRIGQKFEKLHIFNLCISGSIEDRIYLKLYNKLNIFEESIGELEPVLGNLEKNLNIPELLKLSDEEISQKVQLEELSIKRQEIEVKTQTKELEQLINEDYITSSKQAELLSSKKLSYFENQISNLITSFLESHNISYTLNKNKELKLSKESNQMLYKVLRNNMSDKKISPNAYKDERIILQKIQNKKQLKICFNSNNGEDYNTLFLNINHPIIKTIIKGKILKPSFSLLCSQEYRSGYAITYRVDLNHYKNKSWIKTIILDDSLKFVKDCDYFEFIQNMSECNKLIDIDFEKIKNSAHNLIINQIEKLKEKEIQDLIHQLEIKEQSIKIHFDKKIKRAVKMEHAVDQQKIKKMRIAERDNLIEQKEMKLQEMKQRKNIISSFEILATMKIN
jgi:SNF2 family DNA or RNA helicase